jgi:hypothetical protein
MDPVRCPPLEIEPELVTMIERYRAAKTTAAKTTRKAAEVEKVGHYDKDTPMQPRTAGEAEATMAERTAAVALADHLLQWLDRHRA